MPRWLLPVLAVSLLVLLAVAAKPILLPAGNPHITEANYDRIRWGMERDELETILGRPGDYRTRPVSDFRTRSNLPGSLPEPDLEWLGDEATILVCLDAHGAVCGHQFRQKRPRPVGLFDLLRWRWDHWRESRR